MPRPGEQHRGAGAVPGLEGLRLTWEHEDDFDPLLGEIAAARNAMLAAEARMRLLIAYGREFTRPRPYRLEDLARAAGRSISGVRSHRLAAGFPGGRGGVRAVGASVRVRAVPPWAFARCHRSQTLLVKPLPSC
jgi:hypothetical protein